MTDHARAAAERIAYSFTPYSLGASETTVIAEIIQEKIDLATADIIQELKRVTKMTLDLGKEVADRDQLIAELRAENEWLTKRWQATAKFLNGHIDSDELAKQTDLFNHRKDDLAEKVIERHLSIEQLTRERDEAREALQKILKWCSDPHEIYGCTMHNIERLTMEALNKLKES